MLPIRFTNTGVYVCACMSTGHYTELSHAVKSDIPHDFLLRIKISARDDSCISVKQ